MATVYLALGSNLGDKEENLRLAIRNIEKRIGKIISQSAFYHTEPWGFDSPNTFVNAVVAAETSFAPEEILEQARSIEVDMGRLSKSAGGNYADRVIDVDILLYEDHICQTSDLVVPHPLMTQRLFVMQPLAEIAPDLIHPVKGKSVRELLKRLTDT